MRRGVGDVYIQVCIVPVIVIVYMLYSPSQELGGLDHQQQRNVRPVRLDASGAPGARAPTLAKSLYPTEVPSPGGTVIPISP